MNYLIEVLQKVMVFVVPCLLITLLGIFFKNGLEYEINRKLRYLVYILTTNIIIIIIFTKLFQYSDILYKFLIVVYSSIFLKLIYYYIKKYFSNYFNLSLIKLFILIFLVDLFFFLIMCIFESYHFIFIGVRSILILIEFFIYYFIIIYLLLDYSKKSN